MADLQIAPPRDRSVVPAVLIALLILAAVAAAVFYFNPHKTADLRVMEVHPFAPRTEFKALGIHTTGNMRVLDGKPTTASEDDLYVVATVSLTDKLRLPLFLTGGVADVTFADGKQVETHMLTLYDVHRLGAIFPAIADLAANPLADDAEIPPGQTRVGTVILPFPGQTAESWKAKKSATLSIGLRNQDSQSVTLP